MRNAIAGILPDSSGADKPPESLANPGKRLANPGERQEPPTPLQRAAPLLAACLALQASPALAQVVTATTSVFDILNTSFAPGAEWQATPLAPIVTTTTGPAWIGVGNQYSCGATVALRQFGAISDNNCTSAPSAFFVAPGTTNVNTQTGFTYNVPAPYLIGSGGTAFLDATVDTLAFQTTTQTQTVNVQQTVVVNNIIGGAPLYSGFGSGSPDPRARLAVASGGAPGLIVYVSRTLVGQSLTSQTVQTNAAYALVSATPIPVTVQSIISGLIPTTIPIGDISNCADAIAGLPGAAKPVCKTVPSSFGPKTGTSYIIAYQGTAYVVSEQQTTTTTNQTTTTYADNGYVAPLGTAHVVAASLAVDQANRLGRNLLDIAAAGPSDEAASGGAPLAYAPAAGADIPFDGKKPALETPRWKAFASAWGASGRIDGQANTPGARWRSGGFRGGATYDIDAQWRIGAAIGYGASAANLADVGETAATQIAHAGAFVRYRAGPLLASLAASFGSGGVATTAAPAGFGGQASSSYRLSVASLSGETGYRVALDSLVLTPNLGAAWTHVRTGDFAEAGAFYALTGRAAAFDQSRYWVGLKAETDAAVGAGVLTVSAYARAILIGAGRQFVTTAAFELGSGDLRIVGPRVAPLGADIGAAVAYRIGAGAKVFAAYDAGLRERSMDHALKCGLKITW